MDAVQAAACWAAAAGFTFVARRTGVVEVVAARTLQQVAAGACHVAQLRRCTGQDRLRQQWVTLADERVPRQVRVADQRADQYPARFRRLDAVKFQPCNIDQSLGPLDIFLHQVDQVGPAGNETRGRIGQAQRLVQ